MPDKKEDWHIHSIYSGDSITSPYRIVDIALKRKLTRICVTDHNTIRGGKEAQDYARAKNIEVVVGAEMKTDQGEITGLWLQKEIKSRKLKDVIGEIKAQGGKVLIPHPFGSIRRTQRRYKIEEVAPWADYIEIYNGRTFFNFQKRKILKLAQKYNMVPVSGSDAHFAFEIGNIKPRYIYRGIIGFITTGVLNLFFFDRAKRK